MQDESVSLEYNVSPAALLSRGMEAEVYAYGPDAVLKLYAGTASLDELLVLQSFCDSLDRQLVPFALPRIHVVDQRDGFVITVERRLAGKRMSEALPSLTAAQLDAMMRRTLTAALAVSRIEAPTVFDRYKLFDADRISNRAGGDWHQFMVRYLEHKLAQVARYLSRDVPQFAARMQQLDAVLAQPYGGDYRLIHGDFFPGNLLVDENLQITALLDFGLLTMWGDYLFDIASGACRAGWWHRSGCRGGLS